ncbi:MAG: hypothetical protein ACPGUV_06050 [Polyangiales bacterium]
MSKPSVLCLLLLAGLAWRRPAVALAQDEAAQAPDAQAVAAARQDFQQGITAAKAADWDRARDAFAASYARVPRPVTLLNLAGAQAQSGQLVQGADSYRRFLALDEERIDPSYRQAAAQALTALEARIPTVDIEVRGMRTGDAVRLDAERLTRATLEAPLTVNPGAHVVTLERDGQTRAEHRFVAHEGEHAQIRVDAQLGTLWPQRWQASTPAQSAPGLVPAPVSKAERDRGDSKRSVWASPWLWTGVGLVLAAGITAAILIPRLTAPPDPATGNLPPGRITIHAF